MVGNQLTRGRIKTIRVTDLVNRTSEARERHVIKWGKTEILLIGHILLFLFLCLIMALHCNSFLYNPCKTRLLSPLKPFSPTHFFSSCNRPICINTSTLKLPRNRFLFRFFFPLINSILY